MVIKMLPSYFKMWPFVRECRLKAVFKMTKISCTLLEKYLKTMWTINSLDIHSNFMNCCSELHPHLCISRWLPSRHYPRTFLDVSRWSQCQFWTSALRRLIVQTDKKKKTRYHLYFHKAIFLIKALQTKWQSQLIWKW